MGEEWLSSFRVLPTLSLRIASIAVVKLPKNPVGKMREEWLSSLRVLTMLSSILPRVRTALCNVHAPDVRV